MHVPQHIAEAFFASNYRACRFCINDGVVVDGIACSVISVVAVNPEFVYLLERGDDGRDIEAAESEVMPAWARIGSVQDSSVVDGRASLRIGDWNWDCERALDIQFPIRVSSGRNTVEGLARIDAHLGDRIKQVSLPLVSVADVDALLGSQVFTYSGA
jgi:hypothetical protein